MTPVDIAAKYPGLAVGQYKPSVLAKQLGVSRHRMRVAIALAEATARMNAPPPPAPGACDILVVPDAHAMSGQNLRRFTWLGKEIAERATRARTLGKAFKVVSIGDWADMASLSSWDKGKASGENRRYADDTKASREALGLLHAEVPTTLGVEFYVTLGNHENRIARYVNDSPALQGQLDGPRDLGFIDKGWTVVPFLAPLNLAGVNFIHYMPNAMGQAMSGVALTRRLVLTAHSSVIVGHTHWYGHHTERNPMTGKRLHGVVCGCYFEEDHDFAGVTGNHRYDRLLLVLNNVSEGDFDLETMSMASLRRKHTWTSGTLPTS